MTNTCLSTTAASGALRKRISPYEEVEACGVGEKGYKMHRAAAFALAHAAGEGGMHHPSCYIYAHEAPGRGHRAIPCRTLRVYAGVRLRGRA